MPPKFRMSDKMFRQIQQLPSVRARLRLVNAQIAAKTRANLDAAGAHEAVVRTEEGTRPGGRAYARTLHDDPTGEYGTDEQPRHRALGRAIP